jgi:pyridoxal phosphate enzyme (YggS family)
MSSSTSSLNILPSDLIELRYAKITEVIARLAVKYGRKPADVQLMAISKTFSADEIRPVLDAGHRLFGENRVQEAQAKWPELKSAYPDTQLHLVGPLQTNKLPDALKLFDAIHSLDREKLAAKLSAAASQGQKLPKLYVQVNTGEEPQKAGLFPADVADFVDLCREKYALNPIGLMCIPPVKDIPAPHFALLAKIADQLDLPELSMGMSDDFDPAIAQGATCIRLGRALFGTRD